MKKSLLAFLILIGCSTIRAQLIPLKTLTKEAQLVVENDAFTLDLTKDQYYSSGIYAQWRYLLDSNNATKRIRSFKLNHRIYTPKWIGWERLEQFDRPYAGLLSVSGAQEYYFMKGRYLKAEVELGWLGPKALVGETQATWHRWFGMPEPQGWDYQISDTPIANLYLQHSKAFAQNKNVELISESHLALGTIYNYLRHGVIMRLGELKPLHQSSYTSSFLGLTKYQREEPKIEEIYFFYAPAIEYVFYNATIEGSLFNEDSPYTEEAQRWVWQHRVGVMLSWPSFDLGVIAYWRSKENPSATNHNYVGIQLNQRF